MLVVVHHEEAEVSMTNKSPNYENRVVTRPFSTLIIKDCIWYDCITPTLGILPEMYFLGMQWFDYFKSIWLKEDPNINSVSSFSSISLPKTPVIQQLTSAAVYLIRQQMKIVILLISAQKNSVRRQASVPNIWSAAPTSLYLQYKQAKLYIALQKILTNEWNIKGIKKQQKSVITLSYGNDRRLICIVGLTQIERQ